MALAISRLISTHKSAAAAAPIMAQAVARDEAPVEERFARRRPSRTPAVVAHRDLPQPLNVVIRDSSSSGARLELMPGKGVTPASDRLPSRFTLHVPLDRAMVECEVAWRKGTFLGVRYVTPTHTHPRPMRQRQVKQPEAGILLKMLGLGKPA
jgi:hypothetical protein